MELLIILSIIVSVAAFGVIMSAIEPAPHQLRGMIILDDRPVKVLGTRRPPSSVSLQEHPFEPGPLTTEELARTDDD